MQLVSFTVTNYRSITKAHKLPISNSTALVGPNNEGKSNILKALVTALEVLSHMRTTRVYRGRVRYLQSGLDSYDWHKDYPISLQAKHPDGESTFNLEFRLSDDEIAEFRQEVKSNLDGTLPIQLTMGRKDPGFKVLKRGPGGSTLSKKLDPIAKFVGSRIHITYIPAIRTSQEAHNVVASIVDEELATVESDLVYRKAMEEIAQLQKPILDMVSKKIRESLKEFLPNTKAVKVKMNEEARYRAMRRAYEIQVDDGVLTTLDRKGDGVQSLAALGLMRHASESAGANKNIILAIEEPESHLHPNAIHGVRNTLSRIAQKHQVVMTTHCPIFVDRSNIGSNIIVNKSKAGPATKIKEIRESLGVRAADNLMNADLVLIVEGEDDKISLEALLKHHSSILRDLISSGAIVIDTLLGGSNLSYKLSQLREAVCVTYSFLDNDKCGLDAFAKAERSGLTTLTDVTFTTCHGMKESEIEDLFDENIYSSMLQTVYGISTLSPRFKGNKKWSDRIREVCISQGKPWTDELEAKIKYDVAKTVAASPDSALNSHKRNSFDALKEALENKFTNAT